LYAERILAATRTEWVFILLLVVCY
jgi:hypothetical protein